MSSIECSFVDTYSIFYYYFRRTNMIRGSHSEISENDFIHSTSENSLEAKARYKPSTRRNNTEPPSLSLQENTDRVKIEKQEAEKRKNKTCCTLF